MNNGKIKISYGELNVEIEGSDELIYRIFTDIRNNGILHSNLFNNKKQVDYNFEQHNSDFIQTEKQQSESIVSSEKNGRTDSDEKLPDFKSLILEGRKFSEIQWVLLIAFNLSRNGQKSFTKKELRKAYSSAGKQIGLRSKNFVPDYMSLIFDDCIEKSVTDSFVVTKRGCQLAHNLILGYDSDKKIYEAI